MYVHCLSIAILSLSGNILGFVSSSVSVNHCWTNFSIVGKFITFVSFELDSVIPGIQKIWIRTWGCSHNSSDGEYMAGQLAAYGYSITGNELNMLYFFQRFYF